MTSEGDGTLRQRIEVTPSHTEGQEKLPPMTRVRPARPDEHDRVRAMIDDGDAVLELLTDVGAEVVMRVLHLEGDLPGQTLFVAAR